MRSSTILKAVKVVSATGLLAVVCGICLVTLVAPRLIGGASLTVLTGSMRPAIRPGSIVLVKPVPVDEIRSGDVITFQVRPGEATYVTHRVVRVEEADGQLAFVTKGDANRGEDLTPVPQGAVRGKVIFDVPYIGGIADRVTGAAVLGSFAVVGGLVILIRGARRLRKAAAQSALVGAPPIQRGLILANVGTIGRRRELMDLVGLWNGEVLDVTTHAITVRVVGTPTVLDRVEEVLHDFSIQHLARIDVELPGATHAPGTAGSEPADDQPGDGTRCGLLLASVSAGPPIRHEVAQLVALVGGSVLEVAQDQMVVALSGTSGELASATALLEHYGIKSLVLSPNLMVPRLDVRARWPSYAPASATHFTDHLGMWVAPTSLAPPPHSVADNERSQELRHGNS